MFNLKITTVQLGEICTKKTDCYNNEKGVGCIKGKCNCPEKYYYSSNSCREL